MLIGLGPITLALQLIVGVTRPLTEAPAVRARLHHIGLVQSLAGSQRSNSPATTTVKPMNNSAIATKAQVCPA